MSEAKSVSSLTATASSSAYSAATSQSAQRAKDEAKAASLLEAQKDFQSTLLKKLAGAGGGNLLGASLGGSSGGIGGLPGMELGGFMGGGSSGFNFMNIDVEGIEKVWAEQLKTPFGLLNMGGSSDKDSSTSALDSIIGLTVREQMTKVNALVEARESSLDSAVDPAASTDGDANYLNLGQFLRSVNDQIDSASAQFGVPVEEIRRRLSELV